MKIDCIIIEDEPLAIKKLKAYMEKISFLNLCKTFESAIDAIDYIKIKKPQLVFLDIEMQGMTGIQLLESLNEKPKVILTTAYEEYALKGYELQVCDYLLKPVKFGRFFQACEKAFDEIQKENQNYSGIIFIKTEYRLEKVVTSTILYIEGMRDYRQIVTTEKKIMTLQTFKELENILPSTKFARVHNSYIVNIDEIDSIERHRIKIGNKLVPVSESQKEMFYNKIKRKH
jgi:two-component system LytT family response regulator